VGFSLDLKQLAPVAASQPARPAIRAPWGDAPGLRAAVAALRASSETVICVLPGHEHETSEFHCDRQLTEEGGRWTVEPL
jgi:ATP phosphoribosyltransferase regulatory subunit